MKFKYGNKRLDFPLPKERISKIIRAREKKGLQDPLSAVAKSIESPYGTPALSKIIKKEKPESIAIVINDKSRPTPYNYILPPLLNCLHENGIKREQITFVIATGIHEPHNRKDNIKIYGNELAKNYRIVSHDPDDNLNYQGKLSSGNKFFVNKMVAKADFIILTGVILPHYFAGFSGGRKSILPGISGRETIENNHSKMVELMETTPVIGKNPVSQEMFEAAKKMQVKFILNVVTNSNREIVKVAAGDLEKAWFKGVKLSREMYYTEIKQKSEITIASAGGYPRDINAYQAQKALDHADRVTKKGGTIVLLAECREGMGDKVFRKWMEAAKKPEDNIKRIKERFKLGGHKAFAYSKVAQNKEIILISELNRKTTNLLFAKKMIESENVLQYLANKHGDSYNAVLMPQASLTVPFLVDRI